MYQFVLILVLANIAFALWAMTIGAMRMSTVVANTVGALMVCMKLLLPLLAVRNESALIRKTCRFNTFVLGCAHVVVRLDLLAQLVSGYAHDHLGCQNTCPLRLTHTHLGDDF